MRHTLESSEFYITETRVKTITEMIEEIVFTNGSQFAGVAGKLYGRLSATDLQVHGRCGGQHLVPSNDDSANLVKRN